MSRDKRYKLISSLPIFLSLPIFVWEPKLLVIPIMFGVIALIAQIVVWLIEWADRGE